MPSTHLSLHYHVVFSTKNRAFTIENAWRSRLHDYMVGTIRGLGGSPQGIGGVADHVHLLVGLKAAHRLADFLRELKKVSSLWVHNEIKMRDFAWQEGYAAFTVSPTALDAVKRYRSSQEEHHRRKSFHEELISMLEEAAIEYDESISIDS